MNVETANRLVELRKKNGFSQEELADRIGVSRQAVSKWERAESSPDTDNLIALSKLYGVSLDELLFAEVTDVRWEEKTGNGAASTGSESIGNGAASPNTESADNESIYSDRKNFNNGSVKPNKDRDPKGVLVVFPYPVVATILYFLISFGTGRWEYSWLIFLSIPIYFWIARAVNKGK